MTATAGPAATPTETGRGPITYLAAVSEALREEMQRDERVIFLGQEAESGLYGATNRRFVEEFGERRVRDTPIAEPVTFGAGVGAALTGLRPVVDVTIACFVYIGMDQIVNNAARIRYMFGGQATVPIVYRAPMMYAVHNAAQHSDRPYGVMMSIPGIKVVAPATPYDAKALMKAAIRDDDPVIVFEDGTLWGRRGAVGGPDDLVELGTAAVLSEGSDITIASISGGVTASTQAADRLREDGVSVELIDVRSLVPLDVDTIVGSVAKTGRLVIVDPAHRTCSAASEIAAIVSEEAFESLLAPVARVTTPDVHIPYSPALEHQLYPDADKVLAAARRVLARDRRPLRAGVETE